MKERNRILAILLSVVMMVSYMPAIAFAEEKTGDKETPAAEELNVTQPEENKGEETLQTNNVNGDKNAEPTDQTDEEGGKTRDGSGPADAQDYEWNGPDEFWSNEDVEFDLSDKAVLPDGGSLVLKVGKNIYDEEYCLLFTDGNEYDFDEASMKLTLHGAAIALNEDVEDGDDIDIYAEAVSGEDVVWRAYGSSMYRKADENLDSIEFRGAGADGIVYGSEEKPIELIENAWGEWVQEDNGDKYFEYDLYQYRDSDTLTLKYSDGKEEAFTYIRDRDDFCNVDFIGIDGWPTMESNQLENHWSLGGVYEATLKYGGKKITVYYTVVENPVKEIGYSRAGGGEIKFREAIDGVNSDCGDGNFFEYKLYRDGDILTITEQENGESEPIEKQYVRRSQIDEDGDEYDVKFVRLGEDGNPVEDDFIQGSDVECFSDEQSVANEWKYGDGKEHWFTVKYLGVESSHVPVTMLPNPIQSISFVKEGYSDGETIKLVEKIDGYYNDDDQFIYSLGIDVGDKLIINCGGTEYIYELDEEEYGFVLQDDSAENPDNLPTWMSYDDVYITGLDEQDDNAWKPNEDHTLYVHCKGKTCSLNVKTEENPIKGISFARYDAENNPITPIELVQGTDSDYDEAREQEYYYFSFIDGDKLTVKTSSGDVVYSFVSGSNEEDEDAFVNENDTEDKIWLGYDIWAESDQEDGVVWAVGEEHEYKLYYEHCYYSIPVKLVAAECEHDWGKGEETTPASCTASGVMTYTCSKCGETKTEEIKAKGHTEETIKAVAATCTAKGATAGKKCSVCGVILEEPKEVAALGHDYKEVSGSAKTATCTEAGKEADQECSRCHDKKTGAIIKAKGHKEQAIAAVAATCTAKGSTAGKKCSVCGTVIEAPKEVPALGHDYKEVSGSAKAATCTESGKEADKKCSRCGDVKTGATIKAKGHTFGEWKVVKEATANAEGLKERVCSVCKTEVEKETLPITDLIVAAAAIKDAKTAVDKAEQAVKDAADLQKAADEAAKTPGDAAIAAAKKAKEAAEAAQKAAKAAKAAADKADAAADKAKASAKNDAEKTAAATAKKNSSDLVSRANKAVTDADNAFKTAEASVKAAEDAKASCIGTPEVTLSNAEFTYAYKVQKIKVKKKKKTVAVATVQKPTVASVKLNGKAISAANYDVTYSNEESANIGTYTVTVTLKGSYSGKGTATYTINPKAVNLKKAAKGKKSFTASWKKLSKNDIKYKVIGGYQLRYSTDPAFPDGSTNVIKAGTIKSAKKAVKKLQAKTTYYVQLRTYKAVSGVTYYSSWSPAKTVVTK